MVNRAKALRFCTKCQDLLDPDQKGYCNPCKAKYARQYRADNPETTYESTRRSQLTVIEGGHTRRYVSWLRNTYGLTVAELNAMLLAQHGACAICDKPFIDGKRVAYNIDHLHDDTKAVQGLLCNGCNPYIEKFREDPQLLDQLISYLRGK